ncbi:hypothetical protein FFLO_03080 [Filobasidium floriforme]|uniref:Uncharacterized protein n=1 Tax=Filobasidium floriforme TaxID=5210 RepID=A0A8K0NR68_9TREE|nr:hypothetical protein FFLO_03080 [Filobasidium floriforme]
MSSVMNTQPVLHTPGYIYTSASQDIAFSPLAYEHALDFKPLTTGSLLDETFGRRILNNFERIIGDSTGQIGLVVISESTGRLILKRLADAEFLIATNSYQYRQNVMNGVWVHGAEAYPQRLCGISFNTSLPSHLSTWEKTRAVFDYMSRYGVVGHIRSFKPATDERTQEEKNDDDEESARTGIPLDSVNFTVWYRSYWSHQQVKKIAKSQKPHKVPFMLSRRFEEVVKVVNWAKTAIEKPEPAAPTPLPGLTLGSIASGSGTSGLIEAAPRSTRRNRKRYRGKRVKRLAESVIAQPSMIIEDETTNNRPKFSEEAYNPLPWIDDWLATLGDDREHWMEVVKQERTEARFRRWREECGIGTGAK